MLQEEVHGCSKSGICLDEQNHSDITHHRGHIDDQKHHEESILKLVLGTKSQKKELSHFSAIFLCHGQKGPRREQRKEGTCLGLIERRKPLAFHVTFFFFFVLDFQANIHNKIYCLVNSSFIFSRMNHPNKSDL